jgi:hypothetical protein
MIMQTTANEITVVDLGSSTFAYTIGAYKFEARIGAWDAKNPETSKWCVTLNADGVFIGKYAGKEYSRKNAEKLAIAWVRESLAKYG